MENRIETELRDLRSRILSMGGDVEKAVESCVQGLIEKNPRHFDEVKKLEKRINGSHCDIDNLCLEILARMSPVAVDLRFILAVIKINTDLERMGDQCMNLTYNLQDYFKTDGIDIDIKLQDMAQKVRTMIRKSLDAFVRLDSKLADEVLVSDDEIDNYKNKSLETLSSYMKTNPNRIPAALDLILAARNFERMADHATNIAEDVIFACTGEDVRHGLRTVKNG